MELINSDAEVYGGSNVGNGGSVFTEPIAAHGQRAIAQAHDSRRSDVLLLKLMTTS